MGMSAAQLNEVRKKEAALQAIRDAAAAEALQTQMAQAQTEALREQAVQRANATTVEKTVGDLVNPPPATGGGAPAPAPTWQLPSVNDYISRLSAYTAQPFNMELGNYINPFAQAQHSLPVSASRYYGASPATTSTTGGGK